MPADAPYCTSQELADYLEVGEGSLPGEIDKVILDAGEVLESAIVVPFIDGDGEWADLDGADSAFRDGMKAATIRQVEYWFELAGGDLDGSVGQAHDILGIKGEQSVGGFKVGPVHRVAPRAKDQLAKVGLWSRGSQ